MRSLYSTFTDRYHRSGQIMEGDGDGADEFFEKFARGDTVYLYAHLLFDGRAPSFCTRDVSNPCDIGISSSDNSDSKDTPGSVKKRGRQDSLSKEDFLDIFKSTEVETFRDRSIGNFFNLSKLENTMGSAAFANLSQSVQEAVRRKYEESVKEAFDIK